MRRCRWSGGRPAGFTLVELLVVVTVIAILATAVLGGMATARQVAAESRTKSMIARLNQIIFRRYESYRTRRVPIDLSSISNNDRRSMARIRLDALRELICMEMPERFSDITRSDDPPTPQDPMFLSTRPALSWLYLQMYQAQRPTQQYETAECLYLIVMTGPADDRAEFTEEEIGDKDGDGWPEFKDGWGEPIYFFRWAPGFNASEVQPNIDSWEDGEIAARLQATEEDHDPLDPRKLDMWEDPQTQQRPTGWRLVPLIYSAGPDKEPGLLKNSRYVYRGNPYPVFDDPAAGWKVSIGSPLPGGSGEHLDNIHNHLMEQR